MSLLPIDVISTEFNRDIERSHLVIEAETGSGKSTRLPLWAAKKGRVLVVEPRRIACLSLAEYLAREDSSALGARIGYAIKLHSHFEPSTQIVFVTPGVALRWFSENQLGDFEIVVVDEFHERRWDIDLLVALLLKQEKHRLVVTSATIEGDKLASYLGAKRLVARGRYFNVDITHVSRDAHHLPDNKASVSQSVEVVKRHYMETPGDILVFMPGRSEITQCYQMLQKLDGIEVVKLHASVSDTERDKALKPLASKKIVIATNVAETSLTIPNITLVVDSGLERRTLQRNGRTVLSLKTISRASADQRAGRAGRVIDGQCIRLFGEHAPLEKVTPPELIREELTEAMLASASCGYQLSELQFLDNPPEKSVSKATLELKAMGAIDEQGDITPHGRVLYPLPIDTLYADLITRMTTKNAKEAMIDLAAALSTPSSLYSVPSDEMSLDRFAKWEPNGCDAEVLIKLIRGDTLQGLQVERAALEEAKGLARQMRTVFKLPSVEVASRFKRNEFLREIAKAHPELIYVRRVKRRQALGNGKSEMLPAKNSRFSESAEAALILDQHSLPGRGVKQTLNLATVMLPISLEFVLESGVGEWKQGDSVVEKGEVYTQLEYLYAGRVLKTKRVIPEGDLLFKPIVDSVRQQRVLPGFAIKRTQEINHWLLYVALGLNDVDVNNVVSLNFESWFIQMLKDLGISELDELALFSEDELVFDGIPYWQYDEFAQRYPYRLNLGDLQVSVEYVVNRKLVYVIFESGLRKGAPKRWELPKWDGWRVQYKKASRIIDIK